MSQVASSPASCAFCSFRNFRQTTNSPEIYIFNSINLHGFALHVNRNTGIVMKTNTNIYKNLTYLS